MKLKSTAWVLAIWMCGAPIAALSIRPTAIVRPNFLEATVPETFGEWHKVPEIARSRFQWLFVNLLTPISVKIIFLPKN